MFFNLEVFVSIGFDLALAPCGEIDGAGDPGISDMEKRPCVNVVDDEGF